MNTQGENIRLGKIAQSLHRQADPPKEKPEKERQYYKSNPDVRSAGR